MSGQATIVLPTVGTLSGLTAVQGINAAIAALVGKNGGAAQPANAGAAGNTQEAAMDWYDSINKIWKVRNDANSAWTPIGNPNLNGLGLLTPAGAGKNIAARPNAATPNTKIDISADAIALYDSSGNVGMLAQTVAGTIDFGVTGANGLDTGVQAANSWYYGWVIGKPDGTVALLGSLSSTSPTLPAGYTFKALATAARSNGATQFVKYRQFGNWCYYEAAQTLITSGVAVTETAIAIGVQVPPNALAFKIQSRITSSTITVSGADALKLRFVSGSDYVIQLIQSLASQGADGDAQWDFPNVSQTLLYLLAKASTSTLTADIFALAYKLPIGGE